MNGRALAVTRRDAGFTLVELLVTLAILALLAGGAVQVAQLAVKRAQEQELRAALRQIREGLDAYKAASDAGKITKAADASGYPPTLAALTDGVVDITSPRKARLYFLRRLPRDPMADPALSAADTWALRSYDSEPSDPRPGRDVFDVASRSTRSGFNGRPYREW